MRACPRHIFFGGEHGSDPAQTTLDNNSLERSLWFNGCPRVQGSPQESHGRSAGSAGASMLQTPTRTGRLLSIGGAHTWQLSLLDLSQAMKSLQLCQLQASENGPDTAERAPLDARGWVPSVFRAQNLASVLPNARPKFGKVFRESGALIRRLCSQLLCVPRI